MLCPWPFTRSFAVLNEHPLEIIPRLDGVCPQTCELVHSGGLEHNWQIVCHLVGVSAAGSHGDGIASEPLLGVGVSTIWFDPEDLEVGRPLDSPQPCREGSWTVDVADDGGVTSDRWNDIAGCLRGGGASNSLGGIAGGW